MAGVIQVFRWLMLILCVILSIPVLALSANLTSFTKPVVDNFEVLGLLISSATLLVVPLLLVVSTTRKNAFLSYIAVELGILTVLWALWVAAASKTTQAKNDVLSLVVSCSFIIFSEDRQKCNELVATQGLEVTVFVLLLVYILVLLLTAIVIFFRDGNSQVWLSTVDDLQGPSLPALTHKTGDIEGTPTDAVPMSSYSTPAPATFNLNTASAQ